jgi:type I restriction enzyme S subunit
MISTIVDFEDVVACERWRVELFTDVNSSAVESHWPLVAISELADESSEAILPSDCIGDSLLYVGLENVESVTGEPVSLETRGKDSVKSRSKVFCGGDILYGRLRPYLRKAFLAVPPFEKGICSTEFIVLKPKLNVVVPEVLRALLVSKQLTDELARFQIGAALPRISSRDFFSLRLPLPPIDVQKKWARRLATLSETVQAARRTVQEFPDRLDGILNEMGSQK